MQNLCLDQSYEFRTFAWMDGNIPLSKNYPGSATGTYAATQQVHGQQNKSEGKSSQSHTES